MRVAIYARYSSELQKDNSIEDQFALCEAYAKREGWSVVDHFEDRARSGSSKIGRDGINALLKAAIDREFDGVVVEALDRVSRDQEDMAGIFKRLRFNDIFLASPHEGFADTIKVFLGGLMGQLYLEDLARKTKRGLAGVVRDGRNPGGIAYGYRAIVGSKGVREIVPEEAEIVRRIYRDYASGKSPRAIAVELNREGIKPPRGEAWRVSSISGNAKRHAGILHNETYLGKIVWNRVSYRKNPDTGRRSVHVNAQKTWHKVDVPELAILDEDLFLAVQNTRRRYSGRPEQQRRPKHLLSGLIKCGICGGPMAVTSRSRGKTRVGCTNHRNSGTCLHRREYFIESVAEVALGGLAGTLSEPDMVREYVLGFQEERRRLSKEKGLSQIRLQKEFDDTNRAIDRIVDALANGLAQAASIKDRLLTLESRKVELAGKLKECESDDAVIELHPGAIEHHLKSIAELRSGLIQGDASRQLLRDLVESIIVHETEARAPLDIEIRGRLASLINDTAFPPSSRLCREQWCGRRDLNPHSLSAEGF